jgi:hypothetical protein
MELVGNYPPMALLSGKQRFDWFFLPFFRSPAPCPRTTAPIPPPTCPPPLHVGSRPPPHCWLLPPHSRLPDPVGLLFNFSLLSSSSSYGPVTDAALPLPAAGLLRPARRRALTSPLPLNPPSIRPLTSALLPALPHAIGHGTDTGYALLCERETERSGIAGGKLLRARRDCGN